MFLVAANRILASVTKIVSVEITTRLLCWCGPAQVPVINFASCTFFSSPSTPLCGLPHLVLPSTLPLHSLLYCLLLFCDLIYLGLSLSWVMKGMSLGHCILILPIQHKIKSYFFYCVWVTWWLRVRPGKTWVGPKVKAHPCFIWTNRNQYSCLELWDNSRDFGARPHFKTSFMFPQFKALSVFLYAVLVEKSRFLSWRVWYILKSLFLRMFANFNEWHFYY